MAPGPRPTEPYLYSFFWRMVERLAGRNRTLNVLGIVQISDDAIPLGHRCPQSR